MNRPMQKTLAICFTLIRQVLTDASSEQRKVLKFRTRPEHITKWNFASDDWHSLRAENELRVGEKYFARMEAKGGSFGFDFQAICDEVIDKKKLAYTILVGDVQLHTLKSKMAELTIQPPSMQTQKTILRCSLEPGIHPGQF